MVLDNTRVRILIFLTCKLSKVFAEMNLVLIITLLIQKNFRNICNRSFKRTFNIEYIFNTDMKEFR